jgi:hypothetical protein
MSKSLHDLLTSVSRSSLLFERFEPFQPIFGWDNLSVALLFNQQARVTIFN